MADWNGFKKNGITYIPNDATARASISTIEGKIPNGTTSSNPLVNQSTMETALDGKADAGDVTSLSESVSDIEDKIPSNASSSNQLATRSEVSAAYKPKGNATLATLPPLTTANLNNVYNMTEDFTTTADFAEGAGISVKAGNEVGIINIARDPDALIIKYTVLGGFIDLSEYATQASVISALANKVDKVTGKGLSTNDYDNTAKGIVDTAQDNIKANTKLIKDTVGWSGKNLIGLTLEEAKALNASGTWSNNVYTVNSVPFTFETKNGYVTSISCGDATASNTIVIFVTKTLNINKAIKLNGCPSGGGISTYKLLATNTDGNSLNLPEDYGSGADLGVVSGDFRIQLRVYSGQNPNGKVFKPMLRDADILDDTYEPYFGSTAFPRSEQAVLGAKNWFNIDAPIVTTSQNTTYTIASSKTGSSLRVTNSAAGAGKWAYYTGFSLPQNTDMIATFGLTYTSGKAKLIVDGSTDGTNWTEIKQSNSITENGDYSLSFNTGNYTKFRARFYCTVDTSETGDVTYTNIVLKLASDTDTTFAPYAMTNTELTEKVKEEQITSGTWTAQATTKQLNVYRFGKVVQVYGYLEPTEAVAVWGEVISNLPRPKASAYMSDVKSNGAFSLEASGNVGKIIAATALIVGTRYIFSFTYLAAD